MRLCEGYCAREDIEECDLDHRSSQRICRCVDEISVQLKADDAAWGSLGDPVVPHTGHPCIVGRIGGRLGHSGVGEGDHTIWYCGWLVALIQPPLEVADPSPPPLELG